MVGTSGLAGVVDPARFAGMAATQARIVDAGEWTHGPSTLMSVLGLDRAEVANCRVVGWLLDPLSPHGLGVAMLSALGQALRGDDFDRPAKASVRMEVVRPETRADVVITGPGWTVVIEAKVDAPEGDDQGAALERDWPTAKPLVFLTRSGARPPATANDPGRWVAIRWMWFADTAARLLGQITANTRTAVQARHAVHEWVTATRSNLA
jgi:hypothetical protein